MTTITETIAELRRLRAAAINNKCEATITENAAAAVNAVPVLCAEVERLTAENAKLQTAWDTRQEQIDSLQKMLREDVTPAGIEVKRWRDELTATRAKLDRLVAAADVIATTLLDGGNFRDARAEAKR